MPHDLMTVCQKRTLFKRDEAKVWEWVEVPVSRLCSGIQPGIRCAHCHGAVRVHKQQVEHGPCDHIEHVSHQDSVNCKGGHYFIGNHAMSLNPVT